MSQNDVPAAEAAKLPDEPVITVKTVKAELRSLVLQLQSAPNSRVPTLIQKIQRLRLMVKLLSEVDVKEGESGPSADDVYREMVLMTRIVKGGEVADEDTTDQTAERLSREVAQASIDQSQALRLARAFENLKTPSADDSDIPDTYDPPEG